MKDKEVAMDKRLKEILNYLEGISVKGSEDVKRMAMALQALEDIIREGGQTDGIHES